MNLLPIKAFAGLLNLFVILALSLFLPAWTLDFWQAWLFLASFFGPVLAITLYLLKRDLGLLERRVKIGPVAEQKSSQKIIQAFASLFFLLVILIAGFDHRLHWSVVPSTLVVIADVFVVIGLLIVFFVFRENSFTSATVEVAATQKVVTTGPYAVVRHPMYSGAFLLLMFTPIALGSWWALLPVPALNGVIILRLLDEEKLLADGLTGYAGYCHQVQWRLIPHVW